MSNEILILLLAKHYGLSRPQCSTCDSEFTVIHSITVPSENDESPVVGWNDADSEPYFFNYKEISNLIVTFRCRENHEWKLQWNTLNKGWDYLSNKEV